ncbi:hypothetical protein QBC39DRAFT_292384 [Podospora conica]|nr:hypothetical protein QBC39DRAFT_292384 [Schizothecium conicum]
MAHLPPQTAIFSPSVARAAASAAADWSHIDTWLASHLGSSRTSLPPFERNPDTLRALLALAAFNESADESRASLSRLESQALSDLQQPASTSASDPSTTARTAILSSLETSLSREGTIALDALAAVSVESGIAFPTPEKLASRLASIPPQIAELEQASARIAALSAYITSETDRLASLSADLEREDSPYRPPNDLAKANLEAQRHIRNLTARLPELRDRVTGLARSVGVPSPTMEQVRREEEAYLALQKEKQALDAQVAAYEGLPADVDEARRELEALRDELRNMTARRDAVFEGLVERETPRKPTSRRP